MKGSLKRHLKFSLLFTILMYLVISFCLWDITCITNLPNMDSIERIMIITLFIAKELFIGIYNGTKLGI